MSMTDHSAPARLAYLSNLAKVFEHGHTKVSVFSANQFPADLLEIFASLVTDSKRIEELEAQFFGAVYVKFGDVVAGTSHKHFVAGIVALLGSKEHYPAALRYIKANCGEYLCRSRGLFNGKKLAVDTLPLVSTLATLPNYCRNEDGSLRGEDGLRGLMMGAEDCFVLVLSAIANRDSRAISVLAECMPPEQVFGILKEQMKQCPGIGLEEAFGHFFEQKTHVVFLAEMKGLMESTSSTRADFEAAFWSGASSYAIDKLVSEAVQLSLKRSPQLRLMLEVFRDRGVDFYPGLVMRQKDESHYLDAASSPPDLLSRQTFVMDVIAGRAKIELAGHRMDDLSVLLLDIPLETIKSHPDADLVLQHMYQGTKDKSVLRHIKDKFIKGRLLEDSLGM